MNHYEITNKATGFCLGVYEADSHLLAIEACVRDAGYESVADMEQRLGQPCELEAKKVNPGNRPTIHAQPGWFGMFTRAQADGALANGTRVVKTGSKPGDGTADGTPGVILGSLREPDITADHVLYFVEWASRPRVAVAVVDFRVREAAC